MNIPENVRRLMESKAEAIANGEYSSFICEFEEQLDQLEAANTPMLSPVEQIFLIQWMFERRNALKEGPSDRFDLHPQYQGLSTGRYRIDFVVSFTTGVMDSQQDSVYAGKEEKIIYAVDEPMLGIEIDGHDFHEKTKEQARRDKERERFLVGNGWKILRFTGSEVFNDAASCVSEVEKNARKLAADYHKRVRAYLKVK